MCVYYLTLNEMMMMTTFSPLSLSRLSLLRFYYFISSFVCPKGIFTERLAPKSTPTSSSHSMALFVLSIYLYFSFGFFLFLFLFFFLFSYSSDPPQARRTTVINLPSLERLAGRLDRATHTTVAGPISNHLTLYRTS